MVSASVAASAGVAVTALRVIVVIVIAGWILLFAVLIGTLVLMVVLRGRRQREQQRRGAAPSAAADPGLPARLAEVRVGDPHFDEQLRGSRACPACGATYRSELAIECAHCHAERPAPWGQWRLASITAVE